MKLQRNNYRLQICLTAKELVYLILQKFFDTLLSASTTITPEYLKLLANKSVDSHDYEYFVTILDLYEQFERKCSFCFYLKRSFNQKSNSITSLDQLTYYKDDPPDVIVNYQEAYYEFELKRYRGPLNLESLLNFVKTKIINHYSFKSNFLIILQPEPLSTISPEVFLQLHEYIKGCSFAGHLAFSFNVQNQDQILMRVSPVLEFSSRKFRSETELFADILHAN